ncbi:MAG: hypothetical protein J5823_07210 [Paludibacteraceae bacterium]|jgi:hypothetical protein|nr:hypothetical protein [Paludibacteraceae bacterium]
MKNYKMIPKISLWVLLALGIAVIAAFFLGGSSGTLEVAGDFLNVPRFSDLFIGWIYILLGIAILITLCVMIVKLASDFRYNPKRAIRSLCVVVGAIVLCIICWLMGSPEELHIIGYEGTDNVGFWAQLADAVMYLVYILFAATIIAVIAGWVITRTRK